MNRNRRMAVHLRTILIVEDSDDDFDTTMRALTRDGTLRNPVRRCESGGEAIDFLRQAVSSRTDPRPGIILLDLNMPGLDGRKVLKTIKATPEMISIPVIVMTTSDNQQDVDDCYVLGASGYLRKPVDLHEFFDAIDKVKDYWLNTVLLPQS